ncbi:ABC transporter permease [Actinopolymorpha alba]|uniref:ABC transporter permease n=1 Tax=Actinopolymorpha alba TaxID=533267 RepID=UPI0003707E72|nr:ABC transporter permease subunit [Actinopolymorpha alba]
MIGEFLQWFTDPVHWTGQDGIPNRLLEHLGYSVLALVIAAAIGIALGLYVGHTGKGTFMVAGFANALRALPSLGLLFLVTLVLLDALPNTLGQFLPALLVLVILAVPPILTSTYAGVQNVDPAARDAAYGMGMTGREVLVKVEAPCALPLVFSGLRSAMLQIVSTATLAAWVGLGGLGRLLQDGQSVQDYPQMLAGAVLVALLALVMEALLAGVQRFSVPRGLTGRGARRARATTASEVTKPTFSTEPEDEPVAAR